MPKTFTPTTAVDFNITIGLGEDKQVTVYAKDLDQVGEKGLHFALPQGTEVEIGSLAEFITWLNERLSQVGAPAIPHEADTSWPEPIPSIFNGILDAKMKVTRLEVDQDAKVGDVSPPTKLKLAVTGTAVDHANPETPKPIGIVPNPTDAAKFLLSVVGGGIGVTRSYETTDA